VGAGADRLRPAVRAPAPDVFARLFFTHLTMPSTDPDFGDDAEVRRFAHEVLTPMVERVGQEPVA
jgi:hypothetical protein